MKRFFGLLLSAALLLTCIPCTRAQADLGLTAEIKPATTHTAQANAAMYDRLNFDDRREAECATRGLIDAPEALELSLIHI
mgnify:CR=1 FL=1